MDKRVRLTVHAVAERPGVWVVRAQEHLFLVQATMDERAQVAFTARPLEAKANADDAWLAAQAIPMHRVQFAESLPRAARDEIKRVVLAARAEAAAKDQPKKRYVIG